MRQHSISQITTRLLLLSLALLLPGMPCLTRQVDADDELVITVQPEDVEVEYPASASFHVEVDRPEDVASYQWYLSDGNTVFELQGESARSDTLVIPSTEKNANETYFSCTITDKNGRKVFSDDAVMTISNWDEEKPVLYVGEYAIEPGQTLDLSDTVMGSGRVTYDANATDITLDGVHYDNTRIICDRQLSPSLGLMLIWTYTEEPEFCLNIEGENVFNNIFYDPEYNSAGVVINSHFGCVDSGNKPTLIIEGDGTLELRGGSNSIYSDGNIELAATLSTHPHEKIYNDAITGFSIYIDEGAKLDLHPNGTAIRAKGDLRLNEGSVVDIDMYAPLVSVGPTTKVIVNVDGAIYGVGSSLNIKGYGDPDLFVPTGHYLVNLTGIEVQSLGSINFDHCDVSIELNAGESEEDYAMNFTGIAAGELSSSIVLENASKLKVKLDVPEVINGAGIWAPGKVTADRDSEISVYIRCQGEPTSIEADGGIEITDAIVECEAVSEDGGSAYGIVGGPACISFTDDRYHLSSKVSEGFALASGGEEMTEEDVIYVQGYAPELIVLGEKAEVLTPKKGVINLAGIPGYGGTIKAETIYEVSSHEAPAKEVVIGVDKANTTLYIAVAAAACIAAGLFMYLKKKKK